MRNLVASVVVIWLSAMPSSAAAPSLVIRGGSLFDPITGTMEPAQAIVMEGEEITSVGTPRKPVDVPKDAQVIDANGKFILPGLIDAHVHLVHRLNFAHVTGDEVLPLFLASGVTTVRDTGDEIVAQLWSRTSRPRIQIAARVCSRPVFCWTPTHPSTATSACPLPTQRRFRASSKTWCSGR